MPTAVSSYELSVFIHVSAVMIGFGATFAESVMFPVAMKLSPRHLPYVHRLQLTVNRHLALPALLFVLVTGIYQMSEGNWDWGEVWVSGSLTIVAIIAVLLFAYFIPADKRLQPMVEKEIAEAGGGEVKLSDEYLRAVRVEGFVGTATGILLIVAVFLMVAKPGL